MRVGSVAAVLPYWLVLLGVVCLLLLLGVGRARVHQRRQDRRYERKANPRREAHFGGDLLDSSGPAHEAWEQRRAHRPDDPRGTTSGTSG